jgi:hypothetical protein
MIASHREYLANYSSNLTIPIKKGIEITKLSDEEARLNIEEILFNEYFIVGTSTNNSGKSKLFWAEQVNELTEIIYALYLSNSIIINNKRATFKDLAKYFGDFLNVKFANPDATIKRYIEGKNLGNNIDNYLKLVKRNEKERDGSDKQFFMQKLIENLVNKFVENNS